jgi:adenylylsulfate kinase
MAEQNPNNITAHQHQIRKEERQIHKRHKSMVIWFTGLSGSGKSTLANFLEQRFYEVGFHTYILDGDNIRLGINKDLGFSEADRSENIRRIAEIAKLMVDAGLIVITAFVSPFAKDRELVRNTLEPDEFIEVFVDCPIQICEKRDVKGLYKKARAGQIKNFTGIDSPFEIPSQPDIVIKTHIQPIETSINQLLELILPRLNFRKARKNEFNGTEYF